MLLEKIFSDNILKLDNNGYCIKCDTNELILLDILDIQN